MMLILNNVLWINLGIVESYWEMLILVMNRDWILVRENEGNEGILFNWECWMNFCNED